MRGPEADAGASPLAQPSPALPSAPDRPPGKAEHRKAMLDGFRAMLYRGAYKADSGSG
jgi:hypothetical protein